MSCIDTIAGIVAYIAVLATYVYISLRVTSSGTQPVEEQERADQRRR